MGQISLLDQLISNSAFNDCSVTVIYSGVIITDVLLLRDGPSASLALIVLCRCDCVFGNTSASFYCGALHFCCISSAKCTFASVASLWDTSHSVSWPAGLSSLVCEMITYSSPLRTNHGATCLELDKHLPSTCHASTLHSDLSLICPFPNVHTCVNVCD